MLKDNEVQQYYDEKVRSRGDEVPVNIWLAIFSLALGTFSVVTLEFIPIGIMPAIVNAFSISDGQAGLMITVPGVFAALAGPGVMLLAGKADRRKVVLFLSLITVIACVIAANAQSYLVMLFSRALVGICLGGIWSSALACVSKLVPEVKTHKASAVIFGGFTTAMILGVPLGTYLSHVFSWQETFYIIAILAVVTLIAQFIFLPSTPANSTVRIRHFIQFVTDAQGFIAILIVLFIFAAHFLSYTYLSQLLRNAGVYEGDITWILLGFGVAGFVANFFASSFTSQKLAATTAVGIALMITALMLLPLTHNLAFIVTGVMVWGVAWGILPLCMSLICQKVPASVAEAATGTFSLFTQIGIASGSVIGGILVDNLTIDTTYFIAGLMMVITMGMVFIFARKSDRL